MGKSAAQQSRVNAKKRKDYKVKKKDAKIKDNATAEQLADMMFRHRVKQDRRWLRSKVELPDRGGISVEIERILLDHTRKPEAEQAKPLSIDTMLPLLPRQKDNLAVAQAFWTLLWEERSAAMKEQGEKLEAKDWWAPKDMDDMMVKKPRERKAKRTKMRDLEAFELMKLEGGGLGQETDEGAEDKRPPEPRSPKDDDDMNEEWEERRPPEPVLADEDEDDMDEGGAMLS